MRAALSSRSRPLRCGCQPCAVMANASDSANAARLSVPILSSSGGILPPCKRAPAPCAFVQPTVYAPFLPDGSVRELLIILVTHLVAQREMHSAYITTRRYSASAVTQIPMTTQHVAAMNVSTPTKIVANADVPRLSDDEHFMS